MIWNKDILFLHVQKTAGMSVTSALTRCLRRPVFLSAPRNHWPMPGSEWDLDGVAFVEGIRHENLRQARDRLKLLGFEIEEFEKIISVARNPYDLEISRYFHLRKNEAFEHGLERDLAVSSNFTEFVIGSKYRDPTRKNRRLVERENIKSYFSIGAYMPKNLRIVKFEDLRQNLCRELSGLTRSVFELPHLNWSYNRTIEDRVEKLITPETEEAIFARYRWLFQHGIYERIRF